MDTIIKFRIVKPGAFSLGVNRPDDQGGYKGFGNFWPDMVNVSPDQSDDYKKHRIGGPIPYGTQRPAVVHKYDFSRVFSITLLDETPQELPEYLAKQTADVEVQREYRIRNAATAASNHEFNDAVRKQLNGLVASGNIEITYDSFKDGPEPASKTKRPRSTDKA